jgi:hypothetical protein
VILKDQKFEFCKKTTETLLKFRLDFGGWSPARLLHAGLNSSLSFGGAETREFLEVSDEHELLCGKTISKRSDVSAMASFLSHLF